MSRMFDEQWQRKRQRKFEAARWWHNAAVKCALEWTDLRRDGKESGVQRITLHLKGHPAVFHNHYRLNPSNFIISCDELKARGLECIGDVTIEECVGMFLQMVGQAHTMRILAENFQHSEETDTLGAIDGTHIIAFPDSHEDFKERWRNRKGNMTQNVMAVVDFDGRFVVVLAGWEGSGHDSLILRRAMEQGFTVPKGRYYLVDSGYANTHQFLSPYRGITYHLAKFRQHRIEARYENGEELFNHRHAQLCNVVEKAFGILKGRFHLLKDMHAYKYDFQIDIQFLEDASSDDDDDNPRTSGIESMAGSSRCSDGERGSELRDKIRDLLWNSRCSDGQT
ncbi:hypothetical protein LUZ63_010484 [Rhynchospora breviuscula]|uniref:DDE Tnp4 domain-containing protein n=1 Tax=Rhynchospora breviuscula TaxID=2022672 RepID=A0A9Q0CGY5_9POAL|nr:hypothetical protein LUZ63_010484 [Rhynchospora breviuscula]